jgi:hypothetical protein
MEGVLFVCLLCFTLFPVSDFSPPPSLPLFMFCSAFVQSLQQVYDERLLHARCIHNGQLYAVFIASMAAQPLAEWQGFATGQRLGNFSHNRILSGSEAQPVCDLSSGQCGGTVKLITDVQCIEN